MLRIVLHPSLIKRLFLFFSNTIPNVLIAEKLKHFLKAGKKLNKDQSILDLVDSYVIPFKRKPFKSKIERSVINLKPLNEFIPYNHFKMEGLQNLRYLFQGGYCLCKLDLKDAYYCVLFQKNSRKYILLL